MIKLVLFSVTLAQTSVARLELMSTPLIIHRGQICSVT